jgi:hypothetical protein
MYSSTLLISLCDGRRPTLCVQQKEHTAISVCFTDRNQLKKMYAELNIVFRTYASYSIGPGTGPMPRNQVPYDFPCPHPSLLRKILGYYLNKDYDYFIPCPSHFIIHNNPNIQCYII